jgi:carbon monoxide dehydrogenase subunit G
MRFPRAMDASDTECAEPRAIGSACMIPAMDITGSYTFAAPSDRVWELLMNPDVIASCIPGCERFEPDGEDRYRVRLNVALAAVTGSYDGTVTLSDKVAGNSYRLTGEGQGRAGFVKGNSAISLRPDGDATIVDVTATVQTGGAIARVGQRLIGSVTKMMLDRFFGCLQGKLEAGSGARL